MCTCVEAGCTCARDARYYGSSLWIALHTTLLHKDAENAATVAHRGRQMFGVAVGCSSLLRRLECTWGENRNYNQVSPRRA